MHTHTHAHTHTLTHTHTHTRTHTHPHTHTHTHTLTHTHTHTHVHTHIHTHTRTRTHSPTHTHTHTYTHTSTHTHLPRAPPVEEANKVGASRVGPSQLQHFARGSLYLLTVDSEPFLRNVWVNHLTKINNTQNGKSNHYCTEDYLMLNNK